MDELDVDNVAGFSYLNEDDATKAEQIQVIFKDGSERIYEGDDLPHVAELLRFWTPPMA